VTYGAQNQPTSKIRYKPGGTYGIPSFDGRESRSAAARVGTPYDVVEGFEGREFAPVQPEIEPTKLGLAIRNKEVIKQRDNARHYLDIDGQLGA